MSAKRYAPASIAELLSDLTKLTPESKIIAGGTDLIICLHRGLMRTDALLYVGGLAEMHQIVKADSKIEIGAAATMREIVASPLLRRGLAAIADAAASVGSVQIRNTATIGGNVANCSAAGDLIVPLFLFKAEALVASGRGDLRCVPVSDIVLAPGESGLRYDEAIVKFIVSLPPAGRRSAFVKLGYREGVTIARISLAASLELDQDGVITAAEMMAAAVCPVPVHVVEAEEFVLGKRPTEVGDTVARMLSDLILAGDRPRRHYKAGAARGLVDDLLKQFC